MYLNFFTLFISSLLAGLAVVFFPSISKKNFKNILAFSGSYLFSITVIHILPELFHESSDITITGSYVLLGFFLQMILEYFSSGVEHGHIHPPHHGHNHHHNNRVLYSMLISLGLHSFLEGTLLVHPVHAHGNHETHSLMYGLIMHKIPEAFALAAMLAFSFSKRIIVIGLLILFALASPLGMIFSNTFYNAHIFSKESFEFLFAIVAGNFLYISTTIFFESNPDHNLKANKLFISSAGAAIAIAAEKLL